MRWYLFSPIVALVMQCNACSDPCASADAWLEKSGVCLVNSRNDSDIDAQRLDADFIRVEQIVTRWKGEESDTRALIDSLKYSIALDADNDKFTSEHSPATTDFTCTPFSNSDCWQAETYVRKALTPEEKHFDLVHEYLHVLLFGRLGHTTQNHPAPYFRESQCSLAWDVMLQYYTWYERDTPVEKTDFNRGRWYPEGQRPNCEGYKP